MKRIEQQKNPKELARRKRERIIILAISVLLAGLVVLEYHFLDLSQKLPFVNSIFFFGLININVILILILLFLIFRSFVKVLSDRKNKVIGSGLKAKLMMAFIGFSLIPTLILFAVSAFYITSSFDKWFSIQISKAFEDTIEIVDAYYKESQKNSELFAKNLITRIRYEQLYLPKKTKRLQTIITWSRNEFNLDAFEYYKNPNERIIKTAADTKQDLFPVVPTDFLNKAFLGITSTITQRVKTGDLIRTLVPVKEEEGDKVFGVVVANFYIPITLITKLQQVAQYSADYKKVNPLQYPIKSIYLIILILITLLIIFAGSWSGYYMAKELTIPIEHLAKGTKELAEGKLGILLEESGPEEIVSLIKAFNTMSGNLESHQFQIEVSKKELEQRKNYIEAILDNIDVGVMSIDSLGVVTTFNKAAERIFRVISYRVLGNSIEESLRSPISDILSTNIKEFHSSNLTTFSKEVEFKLGDDARTLLLKTVKLESAKDDLGCAILIDDVTDIQKAQRSIAWQEVARRIAHEIKNPLTPIKLSAERLKKRFLSFITEGKDVFEQCTTSIIEQVDNLKILVNEFSEFAKLPEIRLVNSDIVSVIEPIVSMYKQANPKISINFINHLNVSVMLKLDPEQFKRVLINLFDNAISAVDSKSGRVDLILTDLPDFKLLRLDLCDNGSGIPEELKNRLFEPYFSTKKAGTGLGLTIAKKIISEHHGYIRADYNVPKGMKFTIELPKQVQQII